MNSSSVNDEGYKRRNQMLSGEDITERDTSKMSAINTRTTIAQATCGASDSNGNREFWIKSDADCKYINMHYLLIYTYIFFNDGLNSAIMK